MLPVSGATQLRVRRSVLLIPGATQLRVRRSVLRVSGVRQLRVRRMQVSVRVRVLPLRLAVVRAALLIVCLKLPCPMAFFAAPVRLCMFIAFNVLVV